MRKYDSVEVARYMMAVANAKGMVLNVTKVQKLLFIAYGYFLAKYNRVLTDEAPRAWPFGPVFPKTRKFIDYGKLTPLEYDYLNLIKKDEELTTFINQLIEDMGNVSASQLSGWSHEEGTPWFKTTKQRGFKWGDPIPDDYIKEYFATWFNVTN